MISQLRSITAPSQQVVCFACTRHALDNWTAKPRQTLQADLHSRGVHKSWVVAGLKRLHEPQGFALAMPLAAYCRQQAYAASICIKDTRTICHGSQHETSVAHTLAGDYQADNDTSWFNKLNTLILHQSNMSTLLTCNSAATARKAEHRPNMAESGNKCT